jgi:hypothetical protein
MMPFGKPHSLVIALDIDDVKVKILADSSKQGK